MRTSHWRSLAPALMLALTALPVPAQDTGAPMSAIDWLSDSVAMPVAVPGPAPDEPAVSPGATVDPISVAPLSEGMRPDALGILSSGVTGLPASLWGTSGADDLARRIRSLAPDMLPALQAQLYTILLAELDPPTTLDGRGSTLFLARIDKLLEFGALDQANALLERAGVNDPEIFRRAFDVSLLIGEEQALCETMADTPELSPTYQARIFCLARAGDWNGATLLLGTGSALGLIHEDDADLFARFLDPDLFEDEDPLPMPVTPTPLTFRMFEAIGQAITTTGLPLAFAHSDLRDNIGWKSRIEAGERLARTGAVTDNQLLGLYTERRAAASGGVWDRVAAVQALEANMAAGNRTGTANALPAAWTAIQDARVEVPIARIHGAELAQMKFDGEAGVIALRLGLLSDAYETVALGADPASPLDRLLVAVAQGQPGSIPAPDTRTAAVQRAFAATGAPVRLASLVEGRRIGEAILRAMALLSEGEAGDPDQITDALALLRAVGLEDTARRAALELLILDRRG